MKAIKLFYYSLLSLICIPALAQGTLYCASSENSYHFCPLSHASQRDIQIINAQSNNCDANNVWGVQSSGIWVDNNCTATFSYSEIKYPSTSQSSYQSTYQPNDQSTTSSGQDALSALGGLFLGLELGSFLNNGSYYEEPYYSPYYQPYYGQPYTHHAYSHGYYYQSGLLNQHGQWHHNTQHINGAQPQHNEVHAHAQGQGHFHGHGHGHGHGH